MVQKDAETAMQPGARSPGRFPYRVRLRTRLFLSLTILLAVLMGIVLVLVEGRMRALMATQAEQRGRSIVRGLATVSRPFLTVDTTASVQALMTGSSDFLQKTAEQAAAEEEGIVEIAILDGKGFVVAYTGRPELRGTFANEPPLTAALAMERENVTATRIDRRRSRGEPAYIAVAPVFDDETGARRGTVRLLLSVKAMHTEIARTRNTLLLLSAVAFGFGALASYLLARRITGPVGDLASGANRAAQGDLQTRLQIWTGDELEELAESFNHMVEQIAANQQAVADINLVLEARVRERTNDLSRMNEELRRAYAELTQVEAQVIAAEKMASLGQLVAGICHEINTPNSAISAAGVNIRDCLASINRQLRLLLTDGVPPEVEARFFGLVERALTIDPAKTRVGTIELRQQSRLVEAKLKLYGLRQPRDLAVTFCRLGLQDDVVALIEAMSAVPSVSSVACLTFLENVGRLAVAVGDIRFSTETITRLVKALKSYVRSEKVRKGYSHLDQADMAEADVHEGIENALTLLGSQIKYGVTVERRYDQLPPIVCSNSELNQVWTNIIHNAVQAMKGVGKITIETFRREHGVGVRITDSGPGIPREHLSRIFDPFFTTKDQGVGSGLGLSISQQIIERHHGEIRVESAPGKTSFEILLPLQPTLMAEGA
jgi:signal transduction histidine kinase